jgi:hypothetical protein
MLALTLTLFGLAAAVAVFSSLWTVVVAFQRHFLWGLAVLFVPLGHLVFLIKAWEEARRPFWWSIVAVSLFGAGFLTMPKQDQNGPLAAAFRSVAAGGDTEPKAESKVPGMFKAQKDTELQIRLIALRQKEADLLERKAALDPKDREGALALTEEIKKYNEELQPVLEQLRENPPKMTSL